MIRFESRENVSVVREVMGEVWGEDAVKARYF